VLTKGKSRNMLYTVMYDFEDILYFVHSLHIR